MIKNIVLAVWLVSGLGSVTYGYGGIKVVMDEICDNGIDDDNDGLIDLNDDDCACNDGIYNLIDLIPNPGFELVDSCCGQELGVNACLEDWIPVGNTPDHYYPNCMTNEKIEEFEDSRGIELQSALVFGSMSEMTTKEIIGVCFNSPLEVDYGYKLSFQSVTNENEEQYFNMALYGVKDCNNLANIDFEMPCSDNRVSEIAIIEDFSPVVSTDWQDNTFNFIADYPYEAFFISLSCSNKTFPSTNTGVYYDNFTIEKSQDPLALSNSEGSICEGDLVLSTPLVADYTYQWYLDGIAIIGANNNVYSPNELGEYQLTAISNDGSYCVESIPTVIDDSYEQIIVFVEETICYGESTTFRNLEFSESGVYDIPFVVDNACDTLYKFKLEASFMQFPNFSFAQINEGESYLYAGNYLTTEGIYQDTIDIPGDCDSLATLILMVIPTEEPNLTHSSSYLNEDCSTLYTTICNTGNVPYLLSEIPVTLYDADPITSNANSYVTFLFQNDMPLEVGECREVSIWTSVLGTYTGDVFAFINTESDPTTPLDFENDFPSTSFSEVNYLDNLFTFNFENCGEECTDSDLTITQISINEDCSDIILRICNTGQSVFSETQLDFGLYDSNPYSEAANLIDVLSFNSPLTILVDDCDEISLFVGNIDNTSETIYIVLNDDATANTPFDLETDFPTTDYPECNYDNNLALFDFDNCDETPTVEICDNGIDDDSDGLIDLNDDDCICNNGIHELVDLIPNPGFELRDDCCGTNLIDPSSNCLLNWEVVSPSPDLYSPDCMTVEEIESFYQMTGITLESSIVRTHYIATDGLNSEILGVCFTTPLIVDRNYIIGVDMTTNGLSNDIVNYSLYGVKSCAQLTSIDAQNPCDDNNVVELVLERDFVNFPPFQWTEKSFSFVADYPYEAFFLSLSCSEPTFLTTQANFYFDNFTIHESQEPFAIASSEGNLCEDNLLLSSPLLADYDYQWYQNGIAIIGATNNEYNPSEQGEYQLLATNADGSICLESLPFIIDDYYENIIIYEENSFCHGGSITLYEVEFTEAGLYAITAPSTTGCDTLYNIKITTPITIEGFPLLVEINEGESYPFGGLLLTEQGTYFDTLSTSSGCDSLASLLLVVNQVEEPNLSYNSHYSNEDCSLLFVTVCNTGNVIFEENSLTVTLYEDDPIQTATNHYEITVFDIGVEIFMEPGDCQELIFWTDGYSSSTDDFYGFINTDASAATPFDFENNFPTSGFSEVEYSDNLFTFNFNDCGEECTVSDLTITLTELDPFCDQLNIKVCNVGESVFSENQLSFSVYNDDPNIGSVDLNTVLVFDTPLTIIVGACYDVYFDITSLDSDMGPYYIMANDDGTADTPFDLVNDFPTTGYSECNYGNNLAVFDFGDCGITNTPEICDNGIDDDNDGLIDAFDPDCDCTNVDSQLGQTLVANSDFEEHTNCCPTLAIGNSCVDNWEAIGGSPDYYGLECSSPSVVIDIETSQINVFDDSFLAIGGVGDFSESIGSCLLSPMMNGEKYKIDMKASLPDPLINLGSDDIEFVLYGFSGACPDFATWIGGPTQINFCNTIFHTQAEILMSIKITDLIDLEFKNFESIITPSMDIDYVVVSMLCNQGYQGFTYFQLANLQITELFISNWVYDEEITVSDPCANTITLSVPDVDTLNYQWYVDGTPILNEESTSLEINAGDYDETNEFYIYVFNDNGCKLIGPVSINPCELVEICNNGIDDDNDGMIDAFDPDCDCTDNLLDYPYEIKIPFPCGNPTVLSVTIVEGNTYQWYVDSVPLIGQTGPTYGASLDEYDQSNEFHVLISDGIDCILLGPISIDPCLDYEICDNGIDDDNDGLIDAFDPDCDCVDVTVIGQTHIPNPGFEEHTGCCFSNLDFSENNCIDEWEVVAPSPDYFGVDCISTEEGELWVNTFDDSFVGLGIASTSSEMLGVCLSAPMQAGVEYMIDVNACIADNSLFPISGAVEIALYGFSGSCPDFSSLIDPQDIDLCSLPFQKEELIAISSADLLQRDFRNIDASITPSMDIDYVIFGFRCGQSSIEFSYFMIANVQISEKVGNIWVYDEEITVDNLCSDPIELSVPYADTLSYQWYQDSIPMTGEDAAILELDPTTTGDSEYHVYVYNNNGCVLVGPATIEPITLPPTNVFASICQGATYSFGDLELMTAGIYRDTLISQNGCDSILILQLSIVDFIEESITATICEEATYPFDNQYLSASGIYRDTLTSVMGCDSIVILDLTVVDQIEVSISESICEGEEFDFNGRIVNAQGLYYDTLSTPMGCDSIVELLLGFSNYLRAHVTAEICDGESFFFKGINLTDEGIYMDTIDQILTCDSIIVLGLSVLKSDEIILIETICEGSEYSFGSQLLNATGVYSDTLTNVVGCDSIIVLDLTVTDMIEVNIFESICEGEEYDFNGTLLSIEGIYFDTLSTSSGCDSIVKLELDFSDYLRGNMSITICEGESFFFADMNLTGEGVYMDTINSGMSCDSIVMLDLVVLNASKFTFEDSICLGESYYFAGEDRYEGGTYFDQLQNLAGCDSIVTFILTEIEMPELMEEYTICAGEELKIGSLSYSDSGDYSHVLEANDGCDTLLMFTLYVQEAIVGDTTYVEIVEGGSYVFYDIEFNSSGIYNLTVPSIEGCDSLIVLDLKVTGGVYVPNIFSTSSVSSNDRFIVVSEGGVIITEYSIFDRWGSLVFSRENFRSSDGVENYWDGYINGQAAMKGVYVYYIQYTKANGETVDLVGSVTVL